MPRLRRWVFIRVVGLLVAAFGEFRKSKSEPSSAQNARLCRDDNWNRSNSNSNSNGKSDGKGNDSGNGAHPRQTSRRMGPPSKAKN
jgi:hypothetical protein